jgi:hypothetical protein
MWLVHWPVNLTTLRHARGYIGGRIVGTLNVILYADPSALTGDASLAPRPRVGLQWPRLGASPGQPAAQLEPVRHFS